MASVLSTHGKRAIAEKILGVCHGSCDEEIKQAYRQRILLAHPDKGGSSAQFLSLQSAYETLLLPRTASNMQTTIEEKHKPTVQLVAMSNKALTELRKRLTSSVVCSPGEDQQRALDMVAAYSKEYSAQKSNKRCSSGSADRGDDVDFGEFAFTGAAGTGKSKLVRFFLLELGYSMEEVHQLSAQAMTLHKYLYGAPVATTKCKRTSCKKVIEPPFDLYCFTCKSSATECRCGTCVLSIMCKSCSVLGKYAGKTSLRFQSNTRTKLHDYVVVEEYSMCSKSDATELKSRAKGSIIIPVGDPNQLPPVGATEPGFPNTDNLPQELSLQKRQAVQSPILLASMELVRKQMCFTPSGRTGDWLPGEKVLRSHGITVRTASAQNNWADVSSITTRLFLTHETMASPLTDIGIICGLHETRRGLNDSIAEGLRFQRQAAFSTENEIWNAQYGAEFFIPAPTMRLTITSGRNSTNGSGYRKYDILVVKKVEARSFTFTYYREATVSYDGWVVHCAVVEGGREIGFCKIVILANVWKETTNGTRFAVPEKRRTRANWYTTTRDNPNSWYSKVNKRCMILRSSPEYKTEETRFHMEFLKRFKKKPTVYNISRHFAGLGMYSKDPKDQQYVPFTLLYYAVDVDLGYATTCHAAQGGEYRRVIVMSENVTYLQAASRCNKPLVYKWGYTAITRASEAVFVFRVVK